MGGESPPDFSEERFLLFAETLSENYPGFADIRWIDLKGVVLWVSPPTNREETVYLPRDSGYRTALEEVLESRQSGITPCANRMDGEIGFSIFLPLVHQGQIQGYLEGVFLLDSIMALSLPREMLETFHIVVSEKDRNIYSNPKGAENKPAGSKFRVIFDIRFSNKSWTVRFEPHSLLSSGNLQVLIFGLALSVALSVLLFFLLQHMSTLKATRDQALHEVSERNRAEQALLKNEKKLESLLVELASKNAELEAFVYTVSHDLKTPIVTIEGFVGALREDFGDRLSAQGERYLQFMSNAAHKMELLISDLLELSRIGRMTENKTWFPFCEIVRESIDILQPLITERGIAVTVDQDLPTIYGERKRLVQVMDNLLSNAVKYMGKENPDPCIQIGAKKQNGQKVFFVRDSGMGIDPTYFEKIFQIFQRLPSGMKAGEGRHISLAHRGLT